MRNRIAALSFIVLLSACSVTNHDFSPNFNRLEPVQSNISISYKGSSSNADMASYKALIQAIKDAGVNNIHEVIIDVPYANDKQMLKSAKQEGRFEDIKSFLVAHGVNPEVIMRRNIRDKNNAGFVVTISHARLMAPDCESIHNQWKDSYTNIGSRNYGCVTRKNLGAMVLTPQDTYSGKTDIRPAPESMVDPLTTYRGSFVGASGSSDAGASASGQ